MIQNSLRPPFQIPGKVKNIKAQEKKKKTIFSSKLRWSLDVQYIGKAQLHCNKCKLINHKYIVQVATKKEKNTSAIS